MLSKPPIHKNGVKEGDTLVRLIFKIILQKVIRDAKINNIRGITIYKLVQILQYADDTDTVEQSQAASKRQQETCHLQNNQDKVKYMPVRKRTPRTVPLLQKLSLINLKPCTGLHTRDQMLTIKMMLSAEIKRRHILSANASTDLGSISNHT
jgi:hypothetical protein